MIRKLLGLMAIIFIFFGTIELTSWALLRNGFINYHRPPPFKIANWEQLQDEAGKNPSFKAVAQIYQNFRSRHPEIEKPAVIDYSLKHEPGKYSPKGEKTGKYLFRNHDMNQNLDDFYSLRGGISGRYKYRVRYTTNEFGRRDPPGLVPKKFKRNIFLMGCSFTWGEGVDQDKIFPSLVAKKFPDARIYNGGIGGASPSTILMRISDPKSLYLKGIDTSLPTIIIFTFIDDHMRRIVGTSEYLDRNERNYEIEPYYFLEGDKLNMVPTFSSDPLNFRWFLKYFGKTNFASATKIELPIIDDYHFRLNGKIFADMESRLKAHFPQLKKFMVVSFPGNNFYPAAIEKVLADEKITFINNSETDTTALLNGHYNLGTDAHPSALTHELYADLLEAEINKI